MSFVDISLIECNRNMSSQGNTDGVNNSIFTNRTGDIIDLKIGDTISIDSAFINQKGCANLNSIEFKGETLGQGLFTYTDGIQITNSNLRYYMNNIGFWYKKLVSQKKQIKDNELKIPVNYYKNSNGEGYSFLPRKYYGYKYEATNHANYKTPESEWTDTLKSRDTQGAGNVYTKGLNSGICYYMPTSNEWNKYNSNDYHKVWEDSLGDALGNYIWVKPKNDNSRFTLFIRDCYFKDWNGTEYTDSEGNTFNGEDMWVRDEAKIPEGSPLYRYNQKGNKDPALSEYSLYQELLEVNVAKGFNSPDSISRQITEQLQEEIDNSPATFTTTPLGYDTSINLTNAVETKLYKTYSCSSLYNFQKGNYDKFMSGTAQRNTPEAFNYWGASNHIWVKRPDIFKTGRECNNWNGWVDYYDTNNNLISQWDIDTDTNEYGVQNFVQNTLTRDATTLADYTSSITTTWLYNETNLKRLNELFKAQGKYPQLFSNENMQAEDNAIWNNVDNTGAALTTCTIDNSRFLHMNTQAWDVSNYGLGDDGYEQHTGSKLNFNQISIPVFFKYNKDNQDIYINEPTTDNLSYGFATRTTGIDAAGTTRDYIVIHPELVNGLSPELFKHRGGLNTPGNITGGSTIIGWDFHYNSWGNVVMTGFTGAITQDYNGGSKLGSNGYYQHVPLSLDDYYTSTYMGANNTALEYDAVNNKFNFQYLHIPENVGNPYNAGETIIIGGDINTTTSIPGIEGASNECYKLNKRLETFSYCPDCVPYTPDVEGQINPVHNKVMPTTLSILNKNIEPWKVFDSHMGVNFNLGDTCNIVNENNETITAIKKTIWEKSFLGILGFTYEQFNPETISALNNGQARVKYDNINSLYNPTTNSQVVSTNTADMIVNKYGVPMYTTQLPQSFTFPFFYTAATTTTTHYGYYPAITINTNSIKLTAQQLPNVVSIPYLTIRTDLISSSNYIGGVDSGMKLPIIAVVNKINADKDYIQLAESSMQFTCKAPVKISSITTTITNPDGTLADTGEGNSVIYKIQKPNNLNNFDIAQQIIKKK